MRSRRVLALPLVFLAAAFPATGLAAAGSAGVAALQVGLHAHGFYAGSIDGIAGPQTAKAVRRLQRRARITVDGLAGRRTRLALGRFGRHTLGSRSLRRGLIGWDVAALQFQLAEHGFPSGAFDGNFGPHVDTALRRYQEWAGLGVDGIAGPSTLGALTAAPPTAPLALAWPLLQPVLGDRFGPRGNAFHAGIDLPAPSRTPVYSARSGQVVWAGWRAGGYGYLVTIAHGSGERTMYAHLSRVDVRVGVWVGQGVRVGLVGATGDATGPHLHFEVRVRGAAVDPLQALPR
jgi:peptidoglycan hydrolase-like protein with peptidoglycan-binding domain